MESSQEENSSAYNRPSSARHTPAASPAPTSSYNDYQSNNSFAPSPDYSNNATGSQQPSFNSQFDFAAANASLFPDSQSGDSSALNLGQGNSQSFPDFINFDANAGLTDGSFDGPLFTSSADGTFIDATALDPSLLDPQLSPQSVLGPMATSSQAPTPPHLLAPNNMHRHSSSPHGSPAMPHAQFHSPSPSHSRHTSLDPSSAAFPQRQQMGEWGGSVQFQGHRRTLSDAHSDISSAHQSPYMQAADDFNHPPSHSPHLHGQDPVMFQDVMGIGGVSLSEASHSYISPAHSPHISPSILPNHHSGASFPTMDNFNLIGPMGNSINHFDPSGMQGVPLQNPTIDYSNMNNTSLNQENPGHNDTMSPPEISIQFAPPSRQASFEPQNQKTAADASALGLPEKQSRGRAKSDPFSSRGSTPAKDLLSPHAAGVGSRSPSPSNKSRRSSTSSVPNRDYILDLADPTRPTSAGGTSEAGSSTKRTQKHPANFQCSLCPKRFTRAYNLRSHLRTHTDERPFVCSHCGKAFARQHDRKRHEGLHSGEKKFVCRGSLKDGNNWGCGRRFARADALGRHFRSEAGRVCIKPLMDEEARERNLQNPEPGSELGISIMPMPNQQMMGMGQPQTGFAYGVSNPGVYQPGMSVPQMPMRLPTALLQQYPTLQGIWDTLPAGGPDEVDEAISGRSSYDASSAGEFEDDDKWNGNHQGSAFGWASDVGP